MEEGVGGVADGIGDVTTFDTFAVNVAIFDVLLLLELGIFGIGDDTVAVVVGHRGILEGGAADENNCG